MTSQSQNASDLLPLCKVWPSAAIFRVTRNNPCPDSVFTIKDFPILITMTPSRRSAPSGRMTTPKPSSTLLPKFSQKSRASWPNLSGLRRGHTSGHQNPRQRPATPRVAKSATMRSDLTCATVTISQAAFIQPFKQGQGTSITSPFYCNLCHGANHFRVLCPFPAIPSWNGRNLSHQRVRGGSTHGFHARRHRYYCSSNATTDNH